MEDAMATIYIIISKHKKVTLCNNKKANHEKKKRTAVMYCLRNLFQPTEIFYNNKLAAVKKKF
jgi:hypothetical protein